ncbi:hypothetical protein [Streptomyces sp. NPDC085665]|uniref:hypothetical protein n=1 Tax=Streptomyces sp. NPDC085665 TaxID=3365735 RepID=UPI0037CE350C
MPIKILSVAVVILLAALIACAAGFAVFAMGATGLSAMQTGGGAFAVTGMLGLAVLAYLVPAGS